MNKNDNGKVTAISDTAQPAAQSIQLKRPALTLSAALSGLLVFSSSLPALAWAAGQPVSQAAVTTFAIPAGSLSHALQALANEANVMLVFTPDQTRNKTSQGLQGQFSVQGAFNQLLAGSGLQAVQEGQSYRLVNLSQTASGEEPLVVPELSVVTSMNDSMVVGRSTLKKENIERIQADNVAALLDKLPGVSSAGSPRPGGQSLNIWGMGGAEDVKITLDGAPKGFEKYRQGSVFIEPELIKQIDVDKGPFNLANGNGGFGGSIKIETKDASDLLQPGENFGGMAKYSFHTNDNQSIYSGALYGRTQEGLADGLLYMSKRDGGDIMRPDNTRFAYSANKQGTYLAKSNIYLTEAQTLTLSGMYSEANGWQPFAAKRDEPAAPSEADIEKYGYDGAWKRKLVYREQTDQNYSVKWNLAPADNPWIDLTLNYGYSKTKQHDKRPDNASVVFLGSLGNESWVDYTDNLVEGSNKSRFSTGPIDHLLEIGTSWHQNKRNTMMYNGANKKNPAYNYGFFQPYYMPAGKEQVSSLYLQDAMTLGTVTVTPGIRYDNVLNEGQQNVAAVYNSQDPKVGHDYSSKRYTGLTPALGLLWKATPNISLFADVTRTWRAPTIDEQYSVQYASSNISGSSRDLQVEKINSVRGGVILNYDNVLAADDSLQVRTTVFRNRGKNEIFWRRGVLCEAQKSNDNAKCGTPLSNYRNLPGYTIEGLEIESFYDSRRIFGSLSFSTIHGDRDASPRDPWGNKTWLPEIPPTTVHTTLGVKIPEVDMALGWTTDLVRKQDRSPVEGDPLAGIWSLPKTKGYALQGLFATWQPKQMKGLEVRVAVDNLFNTNYYPYLGESVSGVGRNIKFSLSQKF